MVAMKDRAGIELSGHMTTFSRDTIYAPLRTARLYNLLQECVGGSRDRADFVRTHVVIGAEHKVVDAGCGTGSALEFLPSVNYFGFDPNPGYIRVARSRYGSRAEFFCGDAGSPHVRQLAQDADVFFSLGVLHHLTDQQIGEILNLARACLRPTGCFVFYEPCFSAKDDWVGRLFMRLDRGRNIKTDQAWRALVSEYFETVEEYIRRPVYLFRYTIQALIGRNPRQQ
jgi:SAM-dependent methyltransferase